MAGNRCTHCGVGFYNDADRCAYCNHERGSVPCTACGQGYMERHRSRTRCVSCGHQAGGTQCPVCNQGYIEPIVVPVYRDTGSNRSYGRYNGTELDYRCENCNYQQGSRLCNNCNEGYIEKNWEHYTGSSSYGSRPGTAYTTYHTRTINLCTRCGYRRSISKFSLKPWMIVALGLLAVAVGCNICVILI